MHMCIFTWHFQYMPETELGRGTNTDSPGLHQTEFQYKHAAIRLGSKPVV